MAHPQTLKVRGIRESTKSTIIKNLVNTKNKIISLPAGEDSGPFFDIREGLLNQLTRVSERTITDLNDSAELQQIIDGLSAAAADAKKEANRLADVSKKIQDYSGMLSKIEGIVGKIIDIAV